MLGSFERHVLHAALSSGLLLATLGCAHKPTVSRSTSEAPKDAMLVAAECGLTEEGFIDVARDSERDTVTGSRYPDLTITSLESERMEGKVQLEETDDGEILARVSLTPGTAVITWGEFERELVEDIEDAMYRCLDDAEAARQARAAKKSKKKRASSRGARATSR